MWGGGAKRHVTLKGEKKFFNSIERNENWSWLEGLEECNYLLLSLILNGQRLRSCDMLKEAVCLISTDPLRKDGICPIYNGTLTSFVQSSMNTISKFLTLNFHFWFLYITKLRTFPWLFRVSSSTFEAN